MLRFCNSIHTTLCMNSNVSPVDLQKEALVQMERYELVLILTATKPPQSYHLNYSCFPAWTYQHLPFLILPATNCPSNT